MKGVHHEYIQDYLDEYSFRRTFKVSPITLMGELMVSIVRYWRQVGDLDNIQYSDLLNDARVRIDGDNDGTESESSENSDDSDDENDDSDSDDSD